MINNLMHIELKTGYSDDGPAWIGVTVQRLSGHEKTDGVD